MIILPLALPDELDRGYLGRIMRNNGMVVQREMVQLLSDWTGLLPEVPLALLLSRAAGIGQQEFVRRHTLLPLRRGITSYMPDLAHGCESYPRMVRYSAMRQARPSAYFCKHCVKEDLDFHGMSYWRRTHQIPGLFWCEKHSTQLHYRTEEMAFLSAPDRYMEDCHSVTYPWAIEASGKPVIHRFLAICTALLDRPAPIDVKSKALPVLRRRASEQGFQTNSGKPKLPLLSDAVVTAFGRPWLATVMPLLAEKRQGEPLTQMDGVLYLPTSASSAIAYAIALTILFDSADDAINALMQGSSSRTPCRRARRTLEAHELQLAYTKVGGNYSGVANALGSNHGAVGKRLRSMGLPNLSASSRAAFEVAARAFFVNGLSLSDSASRSGVSVGQLEELVRTAGTNFVHVLEELNGKPTSGLGSGRLRPLRLTPHEVKLGTGHMAAKFSRKPRADQRKQLDDREASPRLAQQFDESA